MLAGVKFDVGHLVFLTRMWLFLPRDDEEPTDAAQELKDRTSPEPRVDEVKRGDSAKQESHLTFPPVEDW